jgi:hypothetical protein
MYRMQCALGEGGGGVQRLIFNRRMANVQKNRQDNKLGRSRKAVMN